MGNQHLALLLRESAIGYAQEARPGVSAQARITRLIADCFHIIPENSQRAIVAIFARLHTTPAALLEMFCRYDDEIAVPFIVHSPQLDDAMLLSLIEEFGPGARTRAIARRTELSTSVRAALAALEDLGINTALRLRSPAVEQPALEFEEQPDPIAEPAAEMDVAETDLETPEPRPAPELHQETVETPVPAAETTAEAEMPTELGQIAKSASADTFPKVIVEKTGLSLASATALCSDPSSRNMLFALRHIGFETEHALRVFSALAGALADDEAVRAKFRDSYEKIGPSVAAYRIQTWKLDDLYAIHKLLQAAVNDDADQSSSETQTAAG